MLLKIENVTKNFHRNAVLRNFSFSINAGEIVAVTGKSGTGKTTFLRLINNLEKAERGTMAIEETFLCQETTRGFEYTSKKAQREYQNKIGLVFQDYALFPNLNVRENLLEAPLAQKLASKEKLIQKAEQLLEELGVGDQAEKMPAMLSGGQKQRVAIARAMMLQPKVLCFDEPTSALDREAADNIGRLIQKIAQEGTGILIVTHDLLFSETYATRILSSKEFVN